LEFSKKIIEWFPAMVSGRMCKGVSGDGLDENLF